MRLDVKDRMPSGMDDYLAYNGWHFNKKLCEWAISKMRKGEGRVTLMTRDELDTLLTKTGTKITNDNGYDAVYVANMVKADYWGSSITTEQQLAKFVKDYLDDPDGYPEVAMTRFYADIIGKGVSVSWEEML